MFIAKADNPDEVEVGPDALVRVPVAVVVVVPFCAVEELEQAAIANEADNNAAPANNERLFICCSISRSGPTQSCARRSEGSRRRYCQVPSRGWQCGRLREGILAVSVAIQPRAMERGIQSTATPMARAGANPSGSLRRWSEELEGDVVRVPE
jgi:hypothetical protein